MPVLDGRDAAALAGAAQRLAQGELVAFPTETVYGLGARADDDAAVRRIYAAKGRPADHPLIVHLPDIGAVDAFAVDVSAEARALMAHCWPGPLTLILRRREGCAAAAAAGQGTIGLRMPAHPVAQALLAAAHRLGVPGVAAPSANRYGRVSPTTAQHVAAEFGPDLVVLDGGACPLGIESAIVDCTRAAGPALLRPGQLARSAIEAVIGRPLAERDAASPRASGTLASHYAPAAKVQLLDGPALARALDDLARGAGPPPGLKVYSRLVPPAASGVAHRPMPGSAAAVAHELFAVLREFDADGASLIWVEQPPSGPEWEGVRDRLARAAAPSEQR